MAHLGPSVAPMKHEHLTACKEVVANSRFFREYGLEPASIHASLMKAMEDSTMELHVALVGEEVSGFSWVSPRGGFDRSPYLRLLAVDDRVSRRGVGRALMAAMERRHASRRDLLLLVTATNQPAQRFYEALGYELVGTLNDYVRDGVDEHLYRKRLQGS